MPDDQNTTQNPVSTENSIPASPQEPTEPAPINTAHSEPSTMPPEALESPQNAESAVPVNNDNPQNEPISTSSPEPEELPAEGGKTEKISEPAQTPEPQTAQTPVFEPLASKPPPDTPGKQKDLWKRFLDKVQIGKRKKLEKIMALFLQQSEITNDEVEKFLHVSDATATRYLEILEKEGKIIQSGKTGKGVSYSRI